MAPRELKRKLAVQARAHGRDLEAECLFLLSGGALNLRAAAAARLQAAQRAGLFGGKGSVYHEAA